MSPPIVTRSDESLGPTSDTLSNQKAPASNSAPPISPLRLTTNDAALQGIRKIGSPSEKRVAGRPSCFRNASPASAPSPPTEPSFADIGLRGAEANAPLVLPDSAEPCQRAAVKQGESLIGRNAGANKSSAMAGHAEAAKVEVEMAAQMRQARVAKLQAISSMILALANLLKEGARNVAEAAR